MKREAVLRAALSTHGVDPDSVLDRADVSGLSIKDGQVQGEYEYRAPQFRPPANGASGRPPDPSVKGPMTYDDVKKMSREEIGSKWDEVMKVVRAEGARRTQG